MPREFLSCDWGTSSFRLRWICDRQVIREYRDTTGCKAIFDQALASGQSDRTRLYEAFLRGVLEQWPAAAQPLPLIVSGMASSSIGWKELPYASAPLKLDGSNAVLERVDWSKPPWIGSTYLISGAATENEIMRGEETEAIGILSQLPEAETCLLILPGTHSKHLFIKAGSIDRFTTFMTGELFDVLARHSILKATVDLAAFTESNAPKFEAFDTGAKCASKAGLGSSLFQTRTRAILHKRPAAENAWFLSGLLIGAEISDSARGFRASRIVVGGSQRLRQLYSRAMEVLKIGAYETLSDTIVETAVPTAHALFLERLARS